MIAITTRSSIRVNPRLLPEAILKALSSTLNTATLCCGRSPTEPPSATAGLPHRRKQQLQTFGLKQCRGSPPCLTVLSNPGVLCESLASPGERREASRRILLVTAQLHLKAADPSPAKDARSIHELATGTEPERSKISRGKITLVCSQTSK
jgi:hypothetical protein